jgi:hypothetical protein
MGDLMGFGTYNFVDEGRYYNLTYSTTRRGL